MNRENHEIRENLSDVNHPTLPFTTTLGTHFPDVFDRERDHFS